MLNRDLKLNFNVEKIENIAKIDVARNAKSDVSPLPTCITGLYTDAANLIP